MQLNSFHAKRNVCVGQKQCQKQSPEGKTEKEHKNNIEHKKGDLSDFLKFPGKHLYRL